MGELIWDAMACVGIAFTTSILSCLFWIAFKRGAGRL